MAAGRRHMPAGVIDPACGGPGEKLNAVPVGLGVPLNRRREPQRRMYKLNAGLPPPAPGPPGAHRWRRHSGRSRASAAQVRLEADGLVEGHIWAERRQLAAQGEAVPELQAVPSGGRGHGQAGVKPRAGQVLH